MRPGRGQAAPRAGRHRTRFGAECKSGAAEEALDEAIASGATGALPEQFEALDELLVTLDARAGRA